jgi:hypothetical protein
LTTQTREAALLDRFDGCIRETIPVVGEFILPKHLKDMGKDWDTFEMDDIEPLIEKVVRAVRFCAGEDKARELKGKFNKIARDMNGGGA